MKLSKLSMSNGGRLLFKTMITNSRSVVNSSAGLTLHNYDVSSCSYFLWKSQSILLEMVSFTFSSNEWDRRGVSSYTSGDLLLATVFTSEVSIPAGGLWEELLFALSSRIRLTSSVMPALLSLHGWTICRSFYQLAFVEANKPLWAHHSL